MTGGAQPFVDELRRCDRRAVNTRMRLYAALVDWVGEPTPGLPERRDLVYHSGVADSTFTEHFKVGEKPDLARALGVTRDGVDRCVLEAKEFTATPWIRGWRAGRKAAHLRPDEAAEALVRVAGSWAAAHRPLSAMRGAELPPTMHRAALELVGDDDPGATRDKLLDLVREAVLVVVGDPGATGITGLNTVRSRLREIQLGESDTHRRSLELARSIGNFMVLAEDLADADPQLIFMLQLALEELRRTPEEPLP